MKKTLFEMLIEQLYFKQRGNLALYDQLTEVYNYNWLYNVGQKRYLNKEVYVTVIDVNNFKQINDTEGHIVGNMVLQDIAKQLVQLRSFDPSIEVARYGGDEFVVLSKENITGLIEMVNEKKKRISFGVCKKNAGEHLSVAFANADNEMYKYKQELKIHQAKVEKFKNIGA